MYVPTQEEPSLGLLLGELEVQSQTQLMNVLTYDIIFTGQLLHAKHLFKKGEGGHHYSFPQYTHSPLWGRKTDQ